MTRREENPAIDFTGTDESADGGSGEDRGLTDDEVFDTVSGGEAEDFLGGFGGLREGRITISISSAFPSREDWLRY